MVPGVEQSWVDLKIRGVVRRTRMAHVLAGVEQGPSQVVLRLGVALRHMDVPPDGGLLHTVLLRGLVMPARRQPLLVQFEALGEALQGHTHGQYRETKAATLDKRGGR